MRIDVFTIFPALVDGFCRREPARQGPADRAARPALPRPARPHHRRPPHGRRRPVRRRRRDGDAARADLRRRRGRRPAPPAASCSARAAAASTRRWPASWPPATGFSLLCGRYEGVDHRVREHLVDGELSRRRRRAGRRRGGRLPGDRGGRPGSCPGVMGNERSADDECFGAGGLLEEPQYTRPADVPGLGGARGAALGRPRPHRPLAPGPGPAPHARATGPTWSRPGAGSPTRSARLLEEFTPVAYP